MRCSSLDKLKIKKSHEETSVSDITESFQWSTFPTSHGFLIRAWTDAQTLHSDRNGKCNQSASPHQHVILDMNRCWRRPDLRVPAQLSSDQTVLWLRPRAADWFPVWIQPDVGAEKVSTFGSIRSSADNMQNGHCCCCQVTKHRPVTNPHWFVSSASSSVPSPSLLAHSSNRIFLFLIRWGGERGYRPTQ